MSDTGRLLDQIGERAPFPNDAFERMLRRRDRKRRTQRLAAAGVALAVVAAAAVAVAAFDRPPLHEPLVPAIPLDRITFWFDYDGVAPDHRRLYLNGQAVEGTTSNTPEEAYRYVFDPEGAAVVVAPGSTISVEQSGAPDGIRGWIDACCVTSNPLRTLEELDLAGSPTMPTEPGSYVVEFHVPDGPGAYFTLLFPIHVVDPEQLGVLSFSFDPYERFHLVSVSGIAVHGQVVPRIPGSGANYEFVPEGMIEVPSGAPIVFDEEPVRIAVGYIDACCDRESPPQHLYELDLENGAAVPDEPGNYYVELEVVFAGELGGVTFLIPIRVTAPGPSG